MLDTRLFSQVAPVAPDTPVIFSTGRNTWCRAAILPALLPVPSDAPVVTVDDFDGAAKGDARRSCFDFTFQHLFTLYQRARGTSNRLFGQIINGDLQGCLAFRFLTDDEAGDCFYFLLREGKEVSDGNALLAKIRENMGEPMLWSIGKGKPAPVIEVRRWPRQRRKDRIRLCLVAIHIDGEDGGKRSRPKPRAGTRAPRPLVTA